MPNLREEDWMKDSPIDLTCFARVAATEDPTCATCGDPLQLFNNTPECYCRRCNHWWDWPPEESEARIARAKYSQEADASGTDEPEGPACPGAGWDEQWAQLRRGSLIRSWCKATMGCPSERFHACPRTEQAIKLCKEENRCPPPPQ
jgi:hypothetical protein